MDSDAPWRIPNEEVTSAFDGMVMIAAKNAGEGRFLKDFCDAVVYSDAQLAGILHCLPAVICGTIVNICSRYLIVPVYHGIMNAALMYCNEWKRSSNPETGDGYCDIMVQGMDGEWDVVFELKYSRKKKDFKDALDEGEKQVLTCCFSTRLKRMRCPEIHLFSIAFHGKRCEVREVIENSR